MSILNARTGTIHPALDGRAGVCDVPPFNRPTARSIAVFFPYRGLLDVENEVNTKNEYRRYARAAARRLLKMTQIELAAATGLTEKTIVKFEGSGNVRPETTEAIR